MSTEIVITLDRFPEIIEALPEMAQQAMEQSARDIEKAARAAAPVDDGVLRDNISAKREGRDLWTVGSRRPARHGHLVEYGTAERHTESGKSTGSMPAQPWLTPAAEAERPEFIGEMERLLNEL